MSVMDASHREVISLMGEAAAQGEVVLGIRRKMPLPGEKAVFVGMCTCVCVSKCMVGGGAVMILTYLVQCFTYNYMMELSGVNISTQTNSIISLHTHTHTHTQNQYPPYRVPHSSRRH